MGYQELVLTIILGEKKIPNHIVYAYAGREKIFHFCIIFIFLTKNIYYFSNSKNFLRKT